MKIEDINLRDSTVMMEVDTVVCKCGSKLFEVGIVRPPVSEVVIRCNGCGAMVPTQRLLDGPPRGSN